MIGRIRHKGLKRLYEKDDASKVPAESREKIRRILGLLDQASAPEQLDLPGLRLHRLTADRAGQYAVSVSGNWRIVFRFENGEPTEVDLVDYH